MLNHIFFSLISTRLPIFNWVFVIAKACNIMFSLDLLIKVLIFFVLGRNKKENIFALIVDWFILILIRDCFNFFVYLFCWWIAWRTCSKPVVFKLYPLCVLQTPSYQGFRVWLYIHVWLGQFLRRMPDPKGELFFFLVWIIFVKMENISWLSF